MEFKEIDELRDSLDDAYRQGDTDAAVEYLIGVYKAGKSYQDAIGEVMKEAKETLMEIMVETGKTDFKTDTGRVMITKPGVSVRYDTKALDRLAAQNPEAAAILSPHRIEKERAGTMTIR